MQALSVSENALQRIKQQGCGNTSQRDSQVMRAANYRALRYPQLSDPIVELEFDVNNRYSAVNASLGFVHPFVDEVTAQDVIARPTVPGMSMAGVGDLAAISGTMFSEEPDGRLYQRIADGIRGGPLKVSESSPTRQDLADERSVAALEPRNIPNGPITTPQQVTAQLLYGEGRGKETEMGFPERCRMHAKGALYDMLHYGDIQDEQLRAAGCESRPWYVASRGGRLPYVLFVFTLILLGAFLMLRMQG
jgi:hypothetical protein